MIQAAAACPPHYWLVEEQTSGLQHWACYRCGEEREHIQAQPVDRPTAAWASYAPHVPRTPRD